MSLCFSGNNSALSIALVCVCKCIALCFDGLVLYLARCICIFVCRLHTSYIVRVRHIIIITIIIFITTKLMVCTPCSGLDSFSKKDWDLYMYIQGLRI